MKLEYFLATRPLPGHKESECGDIGLIREFEQKVFIALSDVLGHGRDARKIAITIKHYLEKNYRKDLIEIIQGLHAKIKRSVGAVIAASLLDRKTGKLRYIGVGNIVVRKFGSSSVRIVSRSGIIGYAMPTPKEEIMQLYDDDILILHTDGIISHFELGEYPELLKDDAKTVATHIINKFGKAEDDAACIVLRYRGGLDR
jgi:negative regulator of sigma-B (phosphoserine phosphatase)